MLSVIDNDDKNKQWAAAAAGKVMLPYVANIPVKKRQSQIAKMDFGVSSHFGDFYFKQ